jgi:hypothetical protein
MARFVLVHTFEEYRDFEPENDLQLNGFVRVTFNDDKHTAYATLVDSNGDTEDLTWEEAEQMVSTEY